MGAVEILALIVQAVAAIRDIAKNPVVDDAAAALSAIAAIYDAVDAAKTEKITADEAAQAIRDLVAAVASNDAAADASLKAKFPPQDDPAPGA